MTKDKTREKHPSHEEEGKVRHAEAPADASPAPAAPAVAAKPAPAETDADKIAALEDRLLRLRADFDNFRKRALREKNEIYELAASELVLDLLPVLDHVQLGLQAAAGHKAIHEGLQLIFDQLMGVLSKFGLAPFDAEKKPFDPARCEAISYVASEEAPEGTVLVQTRRGYLLRGRLLRPAQVVVSSGPAVRPPEPGGKQGSSPRETPAAAEE